MPRDIISYYLIASVLFLLIVPFIKNKLMKKFIETDSIKKQTKIGIGILIIISMILGFIVNPYFFVFTMFIGTGLIYQGFTGFCGLSIILSKIKWDKFVCDECRI